MNNDLISRQAVIDALEITDWYHQDKNLKMVHGANDEEHQAWYKAEDVYKTIDSVPSAQPEQHGRIFQEIVVEYPSFNTYLEYEGKPYFSVKYVEDGQGYIGYGTYNPKVLSEYLKEYFIQPAQTERKKGEWIKKIKDKEYIGYTPYWYCSECGTKYEPAIANTIINYCYNCGAKMEGETE